MVDSMVDIRQTKLTPAVCSQYINHIHKVLPTIVEVTKIFREEEFLVSNFQGKCNKNKLDKMKTDAIRRACLAEFPLRSHENGYIMERWDRRLQDKE